MTRTVTVTGTGEIRVKPDIIRITFALTAKNMHSTDMRQQADAQLTALRQALQDGSVLPEQLRTSDYNVRTEYEHLPDENGNYRQVFSGYVCRHVLLLEMPLDMAKLAEILRAAENSLTEPELNIAFSVQNRNAAQAEALRAAAAQARCNAEALAEAAGIRLGQLISVSNRSSNADMISPTNYAMPRAKMSLADCGSVAAITPEDIRTEETAELVWEILDDAANAGT